MKKEPLPPPAPILVFFALDVESGYFEDRLKEQKHVQANGFRLTRGTLNRITYIVVKTGPGKNAAAHAADAVCRAHRPPFVISAGFAGALAESVKPQSLVLPDRIASCDGTLHLSTTLEKTVIPKELRPGIQWGGTLFTADKVLGKSCEKRALGLASGADFVDMETYEIAKVCRDLDLPMLSLRAVTDDVNAEIAPDIQTLLNQSTRAGQAGAALALMWKRPAAFKQLCALREAAMTCAIDLSKAIVALAEAILATQTTQIAVPKEILLLNE